MAIRNQHSPKAAMIAALDTRRTEGRSTRARSSCALAGPNGPSEIGFDPGSAARRDRPHRAGTDRRTPERRAVEDRLLGADGLTAHDSSFDRNDILRAWCDALPAGAPIERIEDLAERLIDRMETAPLHDVVPGKGRGDP